MKKFIASILLFFCFVTPSMALVNGHMAGATKTASKGALAMMWAKLGADFYLSRSVPVSKSSMNAAFLRRLASPWGLAALAAVTALGYFWNSSTQKLEKPQPSNYPTSTGTCVVTGVQKSLASCYQNAKASWFTTYDLKEVQRDGTTCKWRGNWYSYSTGLFVTSAHIWTEPPSTCTAGSEVDDEIVVVPEVLDEDELADAREQQTSMTPKEMLTDDTGLADRQVPEIAESLDDMEDDYNKGTDKNPDGTPNTGTQPDTDPAKGDKGLEGWTPYQPVPESGTGTGTSTQPATDCDKHPNSIGCSEYGTVPAPETMQTVEVPISLTPSSWGSGTCPAPISLDLSFATKQFSLQPVCSFMDSMKPVVLAISWLMAGFIVVGAVKD